MDKMRLLLASDLHLGLRDGNFSGSEERLSTFRRICNMAMKHDILLLAGDIIHDESVPAELVDSINFEMKQLVDNGVEVYYTPGRGELLTDGTVNPAIAGLDVTRIFSDCDERLSARSGKGNVYIHGLRYGCSKGFSDISRGEDDGLHIGLFNAGFNPQAASVEESLCIGRDEIKKMNLDFYAMGGNHTFRVFKLANRITGAFAGSAEPCSGTETGDRFALSIEVENGAIQNIRRIAVNTVKILSGEIDCSGILSESELADKIRSSFSRDNCYIIKLTGERDFTLGNMLRNELKGYFRKLDLVDFTRPVLNIMLEELSEGNTMQSSFFRRLSEKYDASVCSPSAITGILCRNSAGRRIFCDF